MRDCQKKKRDQPYSMTTLESRAQHSTGSNVYLHPRFFKVAVDGKYSNPRELKYGVPQGLCSSANIFTCYWLLIKDQINNSITLPAFTDDNSICKNCKAGNKVEEQKTKIHPGEVFTQLKCCMDAMCLKLNPNKTEYILFGSRQQLSKTSPEPLDTQVDPIAVSKAVRYQGGLLDQHLNFKQHIKVKAKEAIAT